MLAHEGSATGIGEMKPHLQRQEHRVQGQVQAPVQEIEEGDTVRPAGGDPAVELGGVLVSKGDSEGAVHLPADEGRIGNG